MRTPTATASKHRRAWLHRSSSAPSTAGAGVPSAWQLLRGGAGAPPPARAYTPPPQPPPPPPQPRQAAPAGAAGACGGGAGDTSMASAMPAAMQAR